MDIDGSELQPETTDEAQPTNSQKRRRVGSSGNRASKKKKVSTSSEPEAPRAVDMWHLKKGDVPKGALGVQKALQIHLRVLTILCSPFDVLPRVSGTLSSSMQSRLTDQHNPDASVQAAIQRASTMNREATLKFEDLRNAIAHAGATNKQSALYRDMRRMLAYEVHIKFAYSALLSLGLSTFKPDIYGNNPDSLYNLLHERIALSMFDYMCNSFAFTPFNLNGHYSKDTVLLQKMYRHFFYSYLRKNGEKELDHPGTLKEEAELDNMYRRRRNLRKDRVKWLKANGYNSTVVGLFKRNESTSEDEYDPARGAYVVKAVTGRSQAVTSFAMFIDEKRARVVQPGRGMNARRTRHAPRTRIRLPSPPPPTVVALPKNTAIDYFDPEYFNENILPRQRAKFAKRGVALPPESVRGDTVREHMVWNNMSDDDFMETYGYAIREQYHIPSQEELDRIAAYEADGEDDSDEDSDEEGTDDDVE